MMAKKRTDKAPVGDDRAGLDAVADAVAAEADKADAVAKLDAAAAQCAPEAPAPLRAEVQGTAALIVGGLGVVCRNLAKTLDPRLPEIGVDGRSFALDEDESAEATAAIEGALMMLPPGWLIGGNPLVNLVVALGMIGAPRVLWCLMIRSLSRGSDDSEGGAGDGGREQGQR